MALQGESKDENSNYGSSFDLNNDDITSYEEQLNAFHESYYDMTSLCI